MAKIGYILSLGEGIMPKVLVAGEGCNAAATLIGIKAPNVPKANINTFTRVDEARAKACVAGGSFLFIFFGVCFFGPLRAAVTSSLPSPPRSRGVTCG
jgi:hypothetical protein